MIQLAIFKNGDFNMKKFIFFIIMFFPISSLAQDIFCVSNYIDCKIQQARCASNLASCWSDLINAEFCSMPECHYSFDEEENCNPFDVQDPFLDFCTCDNSNPTLFCLPTIGMALVNSCNTNHNNCMAKASQSDSCKNPTTTCNNIFDFNFNNFIDFIIVDEFLDEVINPTINIDGVDVTEYNEITIIDNIIRVEDLVVGRHLITVKAPGYAVRSISVEVAGVNGFVQEVPLTLRLGAAVSGVVQYYNDFYNPIEYAKVVITSLSDDTVDYATTDEYGYFEFTSVSAGTYKLFASATGYSTKELPTITTDGETDVDNLEFTYLSNGDAGNVSGTVTYNNVPQEGVTVRIALSNVSSDVSSFRNRLPLDLVNFKPYIETMTDEYGEFEITTAPREFVKIGAFDGSYVSDTTELDLKNNSSVSNVEIVLSPLATIAGTVEDSEENPLEGIRVIAIPTDDSNMYDNLVLDFPKSSVTDNYGNYSIVGLPSGDYDLYVTLETTVNLLGFYQRPLLTTYAGDDTANIEVPENASLSGTIACDHGQGPVVCNDETFQIGISKDSLVTFSNTDGEFTIDKLPPGIYNLFIRGNDFPSTSIFAIKLASGEEKNLGTIIVRNDDDVTTLGGEIEGQIVDEYFDPVPNAIVKVGKYFTGNGININNDWPVRTVTTNEYGEFELDGFPTIEVDQTHVIEPGF